MEGPRAEVGSLSRAAIRAVGTCCSLIRRAHGWPGAEQGSAALHAEALAWLICLGGARPCVSSLCSSARLVRAIGSCPPARGATAGCTAKHLTRDELFKKGWTRDLPPCVKEQGRLHRNQRGLGNSGSLVTMIVRLGLMGKLVTGGVDAGPSCQTDSSCAAGSPERRRRRRRRRWRMHLAAVPAGRSARSVFARQAGLSGAAQLPH